MAPIRVMVVDEHSMARMGICGIIDAADNLKRVDKANSVEQAIEQISNMPSHKKPDVILIDLQMSGALEGIRLIFERHSKIQIVVLTDPNDRAHVESAAEAGVLGFLSKAGNDNAQHDLLEAVDRVHQGDMYIVPELYPIMIGSFRGRAVGPLTVRELEVLHLMYEGLSNQEISNRLFISINTVKTHTRRIYGKLDVNNRSQAVVCAQRLGLLDR